MEFKSRALFHHCYHQTMKQKPRISITIDQGYVPFGDNHNPVFSSLKTYHGFVTRIREWVPRVERELLTFQEHMISPLVFSGVRAAGL